LRSLGVANFQGNPLCWGHCSDVNNDWTCKDKDQAYKDQDKDKDYTCKDKDKDLTHKDQDKDLKLVLKESLRTKTRTSLTVTYCKL